MARSIAYEQHARCRKDFYRPATGNKSAATFLDGCRGKSKNGFGVIEKGFEVGLCVLIGGQACLEETGRGGNPSEISASQSRIQKTVQQIWIGSV